MWKWNIIWFDGTFSKSASTNAAEAFLQLVTNIFLEATTFTKFSTTMQLKSHKYSLYHTQREYHTHLFTFLMLVKSLVFSFGHEWDAIVCIKAQTHISFRQACITDLIFDNWSFGCMFITHLTVAKRKYASARILLYFFGW